MPDYNRGVVTGLNSSLIVIDTERFFLGEQKADGIEVGDTIEWADNGASFLTHLKLLAKKNGGNSTSTTSAAEGTDLKDKLENVGFQNDTYGPADKDKPKISGIYLGNNDTAIMLKIDDKNTPYYATPDLIKYLRSKDCKAKINEAVTLTLEPRPQKLGGGDWATGIGPGSDSPAAEQKTKATDQQQHPPEETTNRQLPSPAAVKPPVAAANVSGPSFRKAVRKSAKLRVGLCGTAGSGKTFTSLLIGFGIGGPIAVIDTENSSAELYAHLGEYDVCVLQAPFTAQKYTDAIHAAERAGYNVIIIDSLSHAWAGEGGLLDLKDNIAKTSKSGNSFTAWKDVTPLHRGLVDAMLQSPCHIIATMRSKTEYVIDTDDRGRSFPRKIGMAPVQREGMDYEFTLVFDIDAAHIATASKDRTSLFTGKSFQPSAETGRQLKEWLETDTSAGGA